ncbi:hypothetical protein ACFQL7_07225 [Halocatena marina]|uniref:Acyl-CoA dehydrogenase n=1 Tax=Halocatena marina TaxID=2934937 RepID=A0ABD5YL88_9EURY
MDFSEPEEATQIKRALDDFIEQEVTPLENKHPEFLGEDYERHIVDENNYQVPAYRDVIEQIRKRVLRRAFTRWECLKRLVVEGSMFLPNQSSQNISRTAHRDFTQP